MKLLLTSAGITNESIAKSLDSLISIPREKLKIAFVPTAANKEPGNKDWFFKQIRDLSENGYSWIDIVDFSAADIEWEQRLSQCDAIFIGGGNTFHLLSMSKQYKFDEWIKDNLETKVFIGASAGSILFTPTIGIATVEPGDINYSNISNFDALCIVNFEISPHTPEIVSYQSNQEYVEKSGHQLYAIDDNTALKIVGKSIEVVSEGEWKLIG